MKVTRVASLLLAAVSSAYAQCLPSATVKNGILVGTTTTLPSATAAVTQFLGVPYAKSPPLRFAPPEPAATWTSPLYADKLPAACFQQFTSNQTAQIFNNPDLTPPAESEDCLYLNIYMPPGTTSTSSLPVMFWIFGGNLAFGTASLGYYDGSSFAYNQNVIIVTVNYRTNIFGFSGAPQLDPSQRNAGFYDQRLALSWVNANIRSFGGDPSKVTLFGESAGALSVEQLVAYPPAGNQFRGAILESRGGLFGNATQSFQQTAQTLGCTDAATQLQCMRNIPAQKLHDTIASSGASFGPGQDGLTYIADSRPRFAGSAAKVPIMLGTNYNEGRVFAYLVGLQSGNSADVSSALNALFPGQPMLAAAALGVVTTLQTSPYYAVSDFITKYTFLCTTRILSNWIQDSGYQTYRYIYNASFPNTSPWPNAGVWHSSEIPEVFGTYPLKNQFGTVTSQQINLSKYMQTAWANFAKNGNPGSDWPQLGMIRNVQDLGGNGRDIGYTINAAAIDQDCPIYAGLINAGGNI